MAPSTPDDELQRRERELQDREAAIRLRELEAEINQLPPASGSSGSSGSPGSSRSSGSTTALAPSPRTPTPLVRKIINAAKFLGVVVVAVVAVRIVSWAASLVIIGGIAWLAYQIFFADKPEKPSEKP